VAFKGIAGCTADAYETPFGPLPIDKDAYRRALGFPDTGILDAAHEQEHSLEVHLPFLQAVLGPFSLVPLVVGDAPPELVAQVLEAVWGGPETLIVEAWITQPARPSNIWTAAPCATIRPADAFRSRDCSASPSAEA